MKEAQEEARDRNNAMLGLLDLIIQMRLDIPVETLHRLTAEFPDQAIILLSRKPPQEAEPVLMEIFENPPPFSITNMTIEAQRPAAALLALRPPAGFAVSLYKSIVVNTTVNVQLLNDRFGRGSSGSYPGIIVPVSQPGWPPIFQYRLRDVTTRCDGGFPIARGIRPIEAYRFIPANKKEKCGWFEGFTDGVKIDLVAQMLDVLPSELAIQPEEKLFLRVNTMKEYRKAILQFVNDEERKFNLIDMRLLQKGIATATEVQSNEIHPTIVFQVEDDRSKKDFPLTEFEFPYPNMRWF